MFVRAVKFDVAEALITQHMTANAYMHLIVFFGMRHQDIEKLFKGFFADQEQF